MEKQVKVNIEYTGHFVQLLDSSEDALEVPVLLSRARQVIAAYLSSERKVNLPYTLLLNGRAVSLALKNEEEFQLVEGDRFKVVPVTTGG